MTRSDAAATAGLWLAIEDRDAALGSGAQQSQDLLFGGAVEFAGGLVRQQHHRVVGQCYGQSGAGEFSAGQFVRPGPGSGGDAQRCQQLRCRRARRGIDELTRDPHVLFDGEMGEQVAGLEQEHPTWRARSRARVGSGWWLMRCPPTRTVPPSGSSSPARQDSSVDLPEPEGPTTATKSPGRSVSETPCSAWVSSSPARKNRYRDDASNAGDSVVAAASRSGSGGHQLPQVKVSVTLRHGSTLSDPTGADKVRITSWPLRQKA